MLFQLVGGDRSHNGIAFAADNLHPCNGGKRIRRAAVVQHHRKCGFDIAREGIPYGAVLNGGSSVFKSI